MKKLITWAIGSLAAACLLTAGEASAQKLDYNFQSVYAGPHVLNLKVFQPWAESMAAKTDGRLTVHYFMSGAMAKPDDVVPSLINGSPDIASAMVVFQDTIMPYTQATDLYHVARDAAHSSEIMWQMYTQLPEIHDELNKIGKVLTIWGSDRSGFFCPKDPVFSPDDVKGKRVLIWSGSQVDMIRSWGGIPVQVSPNDTYMGLQRGMGDMFFGPLPVGVAYKFMEVAKHITVIPAHVGASVMWMNWDAWEDLPEDIQKMIEEETGRNWNQLCGTLLKEGTDRDVETMIAAGCTMHYLTEAQLKAFADADYQVITDFRLGENKRLGIPDPEGWMRRVNDVVRSVP